MNDDLAEESAAAELIAAIGRHRAEFEAAGDAAEGLRTLPPDTVETLRGLGLFWLKTPAELGGTPLNPVAFCQVIEELAYLDVSVAWAAMIGAGCCGLASGWLPGAGVREMFPAERPLPVVAGQLVPRGTGVPVDGGYRVSGRWGFSSGILHADWLIGAFSVPAPPDPAADAPDAADVPGPGAADSGAAGTGFGHMVVFTVPKAGAEVIDNWHVAGLQGTGSLDWTVSDQFIPASRCYELGIPAVRGGDLFRLGMPAFVSNEVPPLAIGLARRAMDDMTALATRTARFPGGPVVSDRAVFHKELGRAEVKLNAARLLHRDAMSACWTAAVSGIVPSEELQIAVTTASVFAVETCTEIVVDLFRYGGGRVLALSNPMQRHLRNVLAARQHLALSEEHYEAAGRLRIGKQAEKEAK
jgi:alkylation response protein AidB-like acyl-CoA dehydrogenase